MIIACLAGLMLVFQACSQNENVELPSAGLSAMCFSAHYPGQTRVAGNAFEQGDTIGLFVANDSLPLEPGGNAVNNEALTSNGNVWTTVKTLYWDNGTYAAYAYYPYKKAVNNVADMPVSVSMDQSTAKTATALGGYEASKGGKTKCDERKDDGNVGKELMERELGEIEGAEGCHNQM